MENLSRKYVSRKKKPNPKENKCRQNLDRGKSSRTPWKRQRQRLEYSSRPQPHPYRPHRDVEAGALALLLNGPSPLPVSLSLSLYLSVSPCNEISLRTAAHQKRKWVLCAPHPPTFVLQPLPRRHFHCHWHCHCYWKKSSFYFGVVQEKRRYVEEFIEPREIRKQHEKRNSFGAQSTPLNGGWNTQRGTHTHTHPSMFCRLLLNWLIYVWAGHSTPTKMLPSSDSPLSQSF